MAPRRRSTRRLKIPRSAEGSHRSRRRSTGRHLFRHPGPMQLGLGFPLPQGPIDEVAMNLYENAMLFGHGNVFGHHRVQVPQIPEAELADLQELFGVGAVPAAGLNAMNIVSQKDDALSYASTWDDDSYYLGATDTVGLDSELVLDETADEAAVIDAEDDTEDITDETSDDALSYASTWDDDSYYLGAADTVGLDSELVLDETADEAAVIDAEDDTEDITDETSEYDMDDLIVSLQDFNPFSVLADLEKVSARYEDVDGTTDVARNQAGVSVKRADGASKSVP